MSITNILKIDRIETDRLLIRRFREADISDLYIGWLNNREVVRFSNQRFKTHTVASCLDYYQSFKNSDNQFVCIEIKETSTLIGTMTLYYSRYHRTVDIGIMIGEMAARNKGYGAEAWNAVLRHCANSGSVRKISAGTLGCNLAMLKLIELSGMFLECIRPQQELVDDKPQDIHYFALYCDN